MKAIDRRLRHLENRLGFAPETEADRLLAARMEAANRRMAEIGYKPHRPLPRFGVPPDRPITVVEILHAARRRAALSRVESNSHESTQQTPPQA
jgi:hypothetical protein